MPIYIVKDTPILHGAKGAREATRYAPGDEIELAEREAAALGGNVEPKKEKAGKKD